MLPAYVSSVGVVVHIPTPSQAAHDKWWQHGAACTNKLILGVAATACQYSPE